MLIPNIFQLDQLIFLKKSSHKLISEYDTRQQQQMYGQQSKFNILQGLRNISYQNSQIVSKIFMFEQKDNRHKMNKYKQQQMYQNNPFINFNNNNKQTPNEQKQSVTQLINITTQKQLIFIQNLYQLLNFYLPSAQIFGQTVHEIKQFQQNTRKYLINIIQKQVDIKYNKKQYIKFAVYIKKSQANSLEFENKKFSKEEFVQEFKKKNNKFYLKGVLDYYNVYKMESIDNNEDDQQKNKIIKPQSYQLSNQLIINQLILLYYQLYHTFSYNSQSSLNQLLTYTAPISRVQHYLDQQYLKLQVYHNYPLLRSKFYLPIKFKDNLKQNQRLQGPIFSNSNPQCMYSHFIGYNVDKIKILENSQCNICRREIKHLKQYLLLENLRNNWFNPYKYDVFFIPEYNRFKLIQKVKIQQQQQQLKQQLKQQQEQLNNQDNKYQQLYQQQQQQNNKQKQQSYKKQQKIVKFQTQIKYLNYLHLLFNLKKIYIKQRNKFTSNHHQQIFKLSFSYNSKQYFIIDPVRGRNCYHYQFYDLRVLYLSKSCQSNQITTKFTCPVCHDTINDNQIIYLRQVQILLKYTKYKTQKCIELIHQMECMIDHLNEKVMVKYCTKNEESKNIEKKIQQIKQFYKTLINPYVRFNQYTLGIPDKQAQKIKQDYIFGLNH